MVRESQKEKMKKMTEWQETPLVSIIVPVYQVEAYISECVESLLAQTYKNLEILLVDDGSTDGSGEICDGIINQQNLQIFVCLPQ